MNTQGHRAPNPRDSARPGYQSTSVSRHAAHAYTAQEETTIQEKLNRVLGPEYVSFRPGTGGQNVSYIEGWKVLNLANEIFGFNGWLLELVSVQTDFLDALPSGRVSLGLSVVVRITIRDGTFHEDMGYGYIENAKSKAMAFEKCRKEAFTDGLKRCLRCFGNVLGNCLYDKSIVAKMQKVKVPPPELAPDDFHRDPLIVKREQEIQRRRAREEQEKAQPQEPAGASSEAVSLLRATNVKDLDDMWSDDVAFEDSLNDRLDEHELALLKQKDEKQPEQVFFTSSKKALDLQKTPDAKIPMYNHHFVPAGTKHSVDPSRSAKVRRADPLGISQSNVAAPALGKRPLGVPALQAKKPHLGKENL